MKIGIKISFILLFLFIAVNIIKSHFHKKSKLNYGMEGDLKYNLIKKEVKKNCLKFVLHHAYNNITKHKTYRTKGGFAEYLILEIYLIDKSTIQFIFKDANITRYEMPYSEPFPYHRYTEDMNINMNQGNFEYDFEIQMRDKPFSLTITRKSTKEVLFSTINKVILLEENYAEITTDIPSENIFGLGERTASFKLKSGTYTLYNHDLYGELEDGSGNNKNRYGSHPMYLMREKSGNYHITYLRNTLPMDVIVDHKNSLLTYKIVGGILDFTIFIGDKNPETSIIMYHKFLQGFSLPPFWSMGFHQCRWGYKSLAMLKNVLINYKINDLPLDTIWMDIDYMDDYMPFSVDESRYNLTEFKKILNTYNKKFVMISEPSMGTKWPEYKWLVRGERDDIFLKNKDGENIYNNVWPGICHFIDFFNPNSKKYWFDAMLSLHKKFQYNGVWLDMNEIATFRDGQIDEEGETISCNETRVFSYYPGNNKMERNTICGNAVHYGGLTHMEVHNYYPNIQSKLTFEFLDKLYPDQFPFILTRANSPGIGKYAAHWSGDNYGRFSFYKLSISEILNNNLFGIPMSGADICGFGEDTPEILCSKWYQMGSLYPFSRSHAHLDSYRKEPYQMSSLLLQTTLKSLQFRYSILKYYYSLFMLKAGYGTIFRPLFMEFYDDDTTLDNYVIDSSFMIGDSLMAIPNLHDDNYSILTKAYFPKGDWYDLRFDLKVLKPSSDRGYYVYIKTKLLEMPAVFFRSGKTIYRNDIEQVRNSYDLDDNYIIAIALENHNNNIKISEGKIPALNDYQSKKEVNTCIKNDCFITINSSYNISEQNLSIIFNKATNYENFEFFTINKFIIYGMQFDLMSQKVTSNIDQFIKKSEKENLDPITIYVKNENCVEISINGELKIEKEQIKFNFHFESIIVDI